MNLKQRLAGVEKQIASRRRPAPSSSMDEARASTFRRLAALLPWKQLRELRPPPVEDLCAEAADRLAQPGRCVLPDPRRKGAFCSGWRWLHDWSWDIARGVLKMPATIPPELLLLWLVFPYAAANPRCAGCPLPRPTALLDSGWFNLGKRCSGCGAAATAWFDGPRGNWIVEYTDLCDPGRVAELRRAGLLPGNILRDEGEGRFH
jgi:hypothetical protein